MKKPWHRKIKRRLKNQSEKVILKGGYAFTSSFEKRKSLEYLRNLIKSNYLNHSYDPLFEFALELLGSSKMIPLLKRNFPEVNDLENFNSKVNNERLTDELQRKTKRSLLKNHLLPVLEKQLKKLSPKKEMLEERLQFLKDFFKLSEGVMEILTFQYLLNCSYILEEHLRGRSYCDFQSSPIFKGYGHCLFGKDKNTFMKALHDETIEKFNFLDINYDCGVDLEEWVAKYLSSPGKNKELSHEFFSTENKEVLRVTDFDIPKDETGVLNTLLRGKERQNILFYGTPGTGKTSFARSLAKKYQKKLYTVKSPKDDDHKERLRNITTTIYAVEKNSLILVDEADEILNSYKSFFFESKTNKSWINSLLESHNKKVIWISNRSSEIDPSTMRRFSFSLEFKAFDKKNRLKVLEYELKRNNLEGYFTHEEIKKLSRDYSVNAGGIVDAINVLNISKRTRKETAIKKINTVLKNHEKAISGKKKKNLKENTFNEYSLSGLNASGDLKATINVLKKFASRTTKTGNDISLSLLLYGLPGTGKTHFVEYMGELLKKEVLLKRCSDIQSCWVGETEKNIARAFQEAEEEEKVLFFDEADSFLFPRKTASQSWEKSFTNEILTQIENYRGIVFFATNDKEGLDHAALRRFKFKIEFLPLTGEGNLQLFQSVLQPLLPMNASLTAAQVKQIKGMQNLTPGDFKVVKDQFLFYEKKGVTHDMLIKALNDEIGHKTGDKKVIGF